MLKKALQPEPWQEALKFMGKCPLCGTAYDAVTAKLFAKKEGANLIHITCFKCKSAFMAIIMTFGQGISSVGMITDLNYEDAKKMYGRDPLTVDEVIEGYQFLQITQKEDFLNYLKT